MFAVVENERPAGLSAWDSAFLKALYHTDHTDRYQIRDIDSAMVQAMVQGIVPGR
ncbi:MAG TPA: hypothetical protein VHW71_03590 [Steroidobacteraceae bacterium]|nr:hypothetical protein [Steroidobacteraceae bacterium]